jgi:hypothetical protein
MGTWIMGVPDRINFAVISTQPSNPEDSNPKERSNSLVTIL